MQARHHDTTLTHSEHGLRCPRSGEVSVSCCVCLGERRAFHIEDGGVQEQEEVPHGEGDTGLVSAGTLQPVLAEPRSRAQRCGREFCAIMKKMQCPKHKCLSSPQWLGRSQGVSSRTQVCADIVAWPINSLQTPWEPSNGTPWLWSESCNDP